MQGMFGPSTADVRTQIDQEITANRFKEKDDFVGLIGSLADRGFGMAAEAMGGGDPRLQKAKLVQEAVAEAREASQPGDVKEMYKNLAASFAKRGLSQEAAQASEAYRKMSREDKEDVRADTRLGLEVGRFGLEQGRFGLEQGRFGIEEKREARAENEFNYQAGRRAIQEQLDRYTLDEKKKLINKLAVEEANLQRRLASGFFEQQDKLALEAQIAQIQSARAQAQAAITNANTSAGRLQFDRERAAVSDAYTKAQTDKLKEETSRLQSEQWNVQVKQDKDTNNVIVYKSEIKPQPGMKPKQEILVITPSGEAYNVPISDQPMPVPGGAPARPKAFIDALNR